jgi:hypothetical protein
MNIYDVSVSDFRKVITDISFVFEVYESSDILRRFKFPQICSGKMSTNTIVHLTLVTEVLPPLKHCREWFYSFIFINH